MKNIKRKYNQIKKIIFLRNKIKTNFFKNIYEKSDKKH